MKRLTLAFGVVAMAALMAMPTVAASAKAKGTQPGDGDYTVTKHGFTVQDYRGLSAGAIGYFIGPQHSGPDRAHRGLDTPSLGSNTDPNDPQQDLSGGQAETAIDAWGSRLVASWNDATGFFTSDSTKRNGGTQGVGYSANGGATWQDLIGLPNDDPKQAWFGDPTVAAIDSHNFVIGGLYLPSNFGFKCSSHYELAVSVLHVDPAGKVTMTEPIVAADGGKACGPGSETTSFLDKELLSFDPVSRTLALSYTAFTSFNPPASCGNGTISLVRAVVPGNPRNLSSSDWSAPIVVSPESNCAKGVEQEGADVTLAPGGDAFVAWETNWESNLFNGDPYVYIDAARVPAGATSPDVTTRITMGQLNSSPNGGVKGLVNEFIAGYNRGVGNDFPRVAYNPVTNRLIVVWNDGSHHPLGDIFMRSLTPDFATMSSIRQVNDDADYTLHFLPSVDIESDGTICSGWYDRRLWGADSPVTDYFGECRPNAFTGGPDFRVTTGATDWTNTSSIIIPNFGDYTDNASFGTTTYYIWSDGRLGVPQPMVDHH